MREVVLRVRVTEDVSTRLESCAERLGLAPSAVAAMAIGNYLVGFERGDAVSGAVGDAVQKTMLDAFAFGAQVLPADNDQVSGGDAGSPAPATPVAGVGDSEVVSGRRRRGARAARAGRRPGRAAGNG